ncbi:hypothetical protein TNCV_3224791 [Trichonephila clavipes]|nr:hypothetical protein TNCV_3224791 [Trichonephila clavipes]
MQCLPPNVISTVAEETSKYPVHRERSEHDVQHVVLHYLASRGHLAGLDDEGTITGGRRLEMYRSAFKLPSI